MQLHAQKLEKIMSKKKGIPQDIKRMKECAPPDDL